MMIYCAHKFGGDRENKTAAKRKITALQIADKRNTYISPIHTFGWCYNLFSYEEGLNLCLDLLARCDELWILSEPSKGVVMELQRARRMGIPVKYAKGMAQHFAAFDPMMEIDYDFSAR